jgi:hypothetical protein
VCFVDVMLVLVLVFTVNLNLRPCHHGFFKPLWGSLCITYGANE